MTTQMSPSPQQRAIRGRCFALLTIAMFGVLGWAAWFHLRPSSPYLQEALCDSAEARDALKTASGTAQIRLENIALGSGMTSAHVSVTVTDLKEIGYDSATHSRGCSARATATFVSNTGPPLTVQLGYVISPSHGIFEAPHIQGFSLDYVVARYAPGSIKDQGAPVGVDTITSAFMTGYKSQILWNKEWKIANVVPGGPCSAQDMNNTMYECPLFIETTTFDEEKRPQRTVLSGRFVYTLTEDHHWILDESSFNNQFLQAIAARPDGSPSIKEIMGAIQRKL